jgi:hypothetical protein
MSVSPPTTLKTIAPFLLKTHLTSETSLGSGSVQLEPSQGLNYPFLLKIHLTSEPSLGSESVQDEPSQNPNCQPEGKII